MAAEQTSWKETVVGVTVIIAVLLGMVYMGEQVYIKLIAPAPLTVSMAAYFVDDSGHPVYDVKSQDYPNSHLKIQGTVYQNEKAVDGTVFLTVTKGDGLFRQSVSVPVKNGRFESDDPAFRVVRPGWVLEIRADVTAQKATQREIIRLNSEAPVDKTLLIYSLIAAMLVLSIVFCLAFTGKKTAWKNQTAIIFSYVVIALFLAVPLLAPVLLTHTFPNAINAMIGAPAGLVNTHTANQEKCETQWALNIGGYSYKPSVPCSDKNKTEGEKNLVPSKSAPATKPIGNGVLGNADGLQNQDASAMQNQDQAIRQSTVNADSTVEQPTAKNGSVVAPIVDVQGGLVIPLYVIILSVIGGAINMTRKVPGFQKEGEESDYNIDRPISSLGSQVLRLTRLGQKSNTSDVPIADAAEAVTPAADQQAAEGERSLEEQARAIDDELAPMVTEQIKRNSDSDHTLAEIRKLVTKMEELYKSRTTDMPLLKFDSFEDWAATYPRLAELLRGSWRVELLNQYMYLISAPFLAIVTYYLLDLLGLSKQGVVVVLSFSVGLISEKIVSWILGIASGYMRTDTKRT